MSDETLDVLIAVYLFEDLAEQGLRRVREARRGEGDRGPRASCSSRKDAAGRGAGDRDRRPPGAQGRHDAAAASASSSASSRRRCSRPRRSARRVGAVAGKFAKHRVESGIGEKMDDALPARLGRGDRHLRLGRRRQGAARRSRTRSGTRSRRSTRQSAKELKAGLEEARGWRLSRLMPGDRSHELELGGTS